MHEMLRLPIAMANQLRVRVQQHWMTQKLKQINDLTRTPTPKAFACKNKKISPLGWFLLIVPVTTFGLGCWQVKRKIWKEKLIKQLEETTKAAPEPLPEDLAQLANMEYRRVKLRGTFLHDKELLMGPRSFIHPNGRESTAGLFSHRDRGGSGYLVVTPFKLADRDAIVLVNRGWVSRKQVNPATRVDGQYDKETELTAVVRSPENRPQFMPDHKGGFYMYRDLPKMCAETGAVPVFLDATYESSMLGGPIGGQTRVNVRNEHLSYLVTWYSLSAATAIVWYNKVLKAKRL